MIEVNDDIELKDLLQLKPATILALSIAYNYFIKNQLKFKITSLISDRKGIKTVSNSHEDGRAFDVSVLDMPMATAKQIEKILNGLYADRIGARSLETGKKVFVLLHDKGNGMHLHFQVYPNLNVV